MKRKIPKMDGGFTSRKLWFCAGLCMLIVGCWLLTAKIPVLAPSLDIVVGGLLGAGGIFTVGNVAAKHVVTKNLPDKDDGVTEEGG